MIPPKVLNDIDFIADLKAAHKGHGRLRLRGRNHNRKQFYPESEESRRIPWMNNQFRKSCFQQDLPIKFATHLAFYGDKTILNAVVNIYKSKGINVLHTT